MYRGTHLLSVHLSKFATICKILHRQALRLHRYHPMSYWIRFAWSAMAISAHDKHSQNVDSQNHSIHGLTWTLHSVGSKIHGTTSRLVRFHGPSKVRNESILTEYCRVIENRLYAIDQRTYSWNQSTLFVKVAAGLPISASLMVRTYLWKFSAEIQKNNRWPRGRLSCGLPSNMINWMILKRSPEEWEDELEYCLASQYTYDKMYMYLGVELKIVELEGWGKYFRETELINQVPYLSTYVTLRLYIVQRFSLASTRLCYPSPHSTVKHSGRQRIRLKPEAWSTFGIVQGRDELNSVLFGWDNGQLDSV